MGVEINERDLLRASGEWTTAKAQPQFLLENFGIVKSGTSQSYAKSSTGTLRKSGEMPSKSMTKRRRERHNRRRHRRQQQFPQTSISSFSHRCTVTARSPLPQVQQCQQPPRPHPSASKRRRHSTRHRPPAVVHPLWHDANCKLTLPIDTPCLVKISAHVDAGHFFVQLPTHPSFASLAVLDQYMLSVYTQPGCAQRLPKSCNVGVLCAAPAYNGWFRAITLAYDQERDEMLVRFVDYGGFARLPRADLRQIRTDFVTLPLQGIECYLANVQPIDDSSHWSDKANELFQQLCATKIIQAALVGYCKSGGIPCVELFVTDYAKKTVSVGQILLERGVAKRIER